MNKGNYRSDWTNRITNNYAQQLSREPFYGLYGDIHNLCIHTAIKDGEVQYSITCYSRGSYRCFLHKNKDIRIMISSDFWCVVLAAISVRMFENLNIVFDRFLLVDRCNISDDFS